MFWLADSFQMKVEGHPLLMLESVLRAQSATKDYVRAENKLQWIFYLFIPQVIIPQASFSQTTNQIKYTISDHKNRKTIRHVLEPV